MKLKELVKSSRAGENCECAWCGSNFISRQVGQCFCSRKCKSYYTNKTQKRLPIPKTCIECGDEFFTYYEHKQKYCSNRCRNEARSKKNKLAVIEKNKKFPKFKKTYPIKICLNCGKEFTTKEKRSKGYCSKLCAMRAIRLPNTYKSCRQCGNDFLIASSDYFSYCSYECKIKLTNKTCLVCGCLFISPKGDAQFCSIKCASKDYRIRIRNRKNGLNEDFRGEIYKACKKCGEIFTSNDVRQEYCSHICAKLVCNKRYALKKINVFVEDVTIAFLLERDKNICQICGFLVDINANFPDRFSSTIDHIYPLSKGGEHSKANTQLAHLTCNARKRNKVIK